MRDKGKRESKDEGQTMRLEYNVIDKHTSPGLFGRERDLDSNKK